MFRSTRIRPGLTGQFAPRGAELDLCRAARDLPSRPRIPRLGMFTKRAGDCPPRFSSPGCSYCGAARHIACSAMCRGVRRLARFSQRQFRRRWSLPGLPGTGRSRPAERGISRRPATPPLAVPCMRPSVDHETSRSELGDLRASSNEPAYSDRRSDTREGVQFCRY
jgi:hypothetical protein